MKRSFMKKLCSVTLTLAMVMSLFTGLSFGAETIIFDAPSAPTAVDRSIITGTAHNSASPTLDMLGVNLVSGIGSFGMGGSLTTLEDAQKRAALGIWGTDLNVNKDPYAANFFYNFTQDENGKINDATLLETRGDRGVNPMVADNNVDYMKEEYGGVTSSIYPRPDILFGCATANGKDDDTGYDSQVETINNFVEGDGFYRPADEYYVGDENYNPKRVKVANNSIKDHIRSLRNLATAINEVIAESNGTKTVRYGDPQIIVDNYEKYVYGSVGYIASKIASGEVQKKTVAIIGSVNEDGTYVLNDTTTHTANNSIDRVVEYARLITDNLADQCAEVDNGNGVMVKVATAEEVAKADVVITSYLDNANAAEAHNAIPEILAAQPTYNENMIIIPDVPSTMFSIVNNSYENAMGFGFFSSYMYSDVLDLNPVEFCALFYEYICHINGDLASLKKVVATNFDGKHLPEGIANTLPDDYNKIKVESYLAEGLSYVDSHHDEFAGVFELSDYVVDWSQGMCAGLGQSKAKQTVKLSNLSKTYKVSDLKDKAKTFNVKATAETKVTFSKVSGDKVLSISKAGKVTVKKGTKDGTYKMKIKAKAAESDSYKAASVTKTVKVVVKKNQSVKVTGLSKTVKASAVKSKAVSFKLGVEKAKGEVTFSKASGDKALSISKAGKVTVKKGTKKGTYKMTIKVEAAATKTYAAVSGKATVKVTVK